VQAAQALAAECGVANARFVISDVLGATAALPGDADKADPVFTTRGTIGWISATRLGMASVRIDAIRPRKQSGRFRPG
jgi:hypothetical protein